MPAYVMSLGLCTCPRDFRGFRYLETDRVEEEAELNFELFESFHFIF